MRSDNQSLRRALPSLHSLVLFEAAARFLNFSKAAEELSITQPAVSHGIRQLESSLGHALFVRERRGLSLTTQGQRLYAAVAGGFASIAETVEGIAGMPEHDTLVLSTSVVMATEWLMPRLASFRAEHPNLLVDLRSIDREPNLIADGIDVHLRLGDGNWAACEARSLWPEEIVPVCSPRYRGRAGPVTEIGDLLRHRLIHYVDSHRLRIGWFEWFKAAGAGAPEVLPTMLHVNDSLLALKAAEAGEGVALGWRPVIDQAVAEGRLVVALDRPVSTGRHFYAVTASAPNRRRTALAFRDWLVGEVGKTGTSDVRG